jgi:hypothetical protein
MYRVVHNLFEVAKLLKSSDVGIFPEIVSVHHPNATVLYYPVYYQYILGAAL